MDTGSFLLFSVYLLCCTIVSKRRMLQAWGQLLCKGQDFSGDSSRWLVLGGECSVFSSWITLSIQVWCKTHNNPMLVSILRFKWKHIGFIFSLRFKKKADCKISFLSFSTTIPCSWDHWQLPATPRPHKGIVLACGNYTEKCWFASSCLPFLTTSLLLSFWFLLLNKEEM